MGCQTLFQGGTLFVDRLQNKVMYCSKQVTGWCAPPITSASHLDLQTSRVDHAAASMSFMLISEHNVATNALGTQTHIACGLAAAKTMSV